jgi:hypothetical protein
MGRVVGFLDLSSDMQPGGFLRIGFCLPLSVPKLPDSGSCLPCVLLLLNSLGSRDFAGDPPYARAEAVAAHGLASPVERGMNKTTIRN